MRGAFRTVLLAGFLTVVSMASQAMNPFGTAGLPLNKQDYQAMSTAAQPLLSDDTLPIGTTEDWSNAKSGNQGTIKLLERFVTDYQGTKMPCRKLRYHIRVKGMADPYNLILDRCQVADGSWKIL
jgi:hypothetical protein